MQFSISSLLANFSDDKLIAPKVLEKKLDCEEGEGLHQLQIALDALERVGVLLKERGKYRRLHEEGVVEGRLRCSSKGFCFAIQEQEGSEDVFVRENQLSTAWNGDLVLVKVTREGRRKRSPEGEVKLILERSNPSVIARIKQTESGFRAVPLDDRLLFEVEILPNGTVADLTAVVDQLVHVIIVRYPLGAYPPLGEINQVLGEDAQSAPAIDLICCKHDLPRQFSGMAQGVAIALNQELEAASLQSSWEGRQDLRNLQTIALDWPWQEMQAAFSLEPLGSQTWQLGIHISDVAAQVPFNSALDREVRRRALAVATQDLTIPLFPPELTALRLVPGGDRPCLSLLVTITGQGDVQAYEIQPSVVRVDQTLNPEDVSKILAKKGKFSLGDLLQTLGQISTGLSEQRQQRGTLAAPLNLTLPMGYGDEGIFTALQSQSGLDPSSLMILANELLGNHLANLGLPAIYRHQEPPELYAIQDFIKLAQNLDLPLNLSDTSQVTSQDYQRFIHQLQTSDLADVLLELLCDTLKVPADTATAAAHFSLALTGPYAHCCAPLQRYSDVLNQRVIHALLDKGRDRRTARAKESVNLRHHSCLDQVNWNVLPPDDQRDLEGAIADILPDLQEQERTVYQAWKDLQGLLRVRRVQACAGETRPGIITGVQSYGFFVELIDFSVEGLVHVSSLKDDWYEYRSQAQTLTGRRNHLRYRLGDRVDVMIKNVDSYRQQVDLAVVGGGSQASEEELQVAAEPDSENEQEEDSDQD
ncbi:ribonuclease R [Candidatus Synechococcus calcipolaris G9]|uniref:Ribonuclease R n=1 Tax=Candidatus Synechococcus calcipolaris G9 TaxID=1497997 RepID=A0ABT6EWH0_9SYNE|nr:ribonuclease R family protein [Candidatus Synechococcus calcipolaris]MDG2990121.1 ribonuclease R [Candidatus Synechococcus calcipolaris G9]